MKLNLDIIRDHLPDVYKTRSFGPKNKALSLSRPLLCEAGTNLEEGQLYLAYANILNTISATKNVYLICIGNQLDHNWIVQGAQILQIQHPQDFLTIFNDICKIFDRFDEWETALRNEIENQIDFNIQNVLQLGAQILDNEISVTDHSLQVILRAKIETSEKEQQLVTISDTPLPIDIRFSENIKNVCQIERTITVPYISSLETSETKQIRYYCKNLYPLGHFTGCIAVGESNHSFRESDFALSDYYFTYFQKAFLKYLQSFSPSESDAVSALRHLINHVPLTPAEYEHFTLHPDECWVCFKLSEKRNSRYMPKDYMYSTLNTLMVKIVYAVLCHDEILGIIRLPSKSDINTLVLFQELLNRMNYTAGISNKFTQIEQANFYFLQANYAAEKYHLNPEKGILYYFSDYTLEYMLNECTGNLPLSSLYSDGLITVIEYDRKRNTNYLHTLDVYLKNEMSITQTSKELFIHRSSLLKRLDKIRRLIPENLEDPNVRLYYRLSLALLEAANNNLLH